MKITLISASAACSAGVLLFAVPESASAHDRSITDAQARYERDRAACSSGQSSQDRATSVREAAAARDEARHEIRREPRNATARATGGDQARFEQNRMLRCEPLPQGQREDCIRRMRGEGTVSGSVEGGGIYRELRSTVVPPEKPE
jgi:hypothetical protein